jgi:hypothetical protein
MIAPRFSDDLCRRIDPDHDTRRDAPGKIGGNRPQRPRPASGRRRANTASDRPPSSHRSPTMGSQDAFVMTVRVPPVHQSRLRLQPVQHEQGAAASTDRRSSRSRAVGHWRDGWRTSQPRNCSCMAAAAVDLRRRLGGSIVTAISQRSAVVVASPSARQNARGRCGRKPGSAAPAHRPVRCNVAIAGVGRRVAIHLPSAEKRGSFRATSRRGTSCSPGSPSGERHHPDVVVAPLVLAVKVSRLRSTTGTGRPPRTRASRSSPPVPSAA